MDQVQATAITTKLFDRQLTLLTGIARGQSFDARYVWRTILACEKVQSGDFEGAKELAKDEE